MNSGWVDVTLLRDFQAEGTDAHRLCTIDDGWVERFGRDVLISFKRVLARERLVQELQAWASTVPFEFGRVFARFIPRKNEEREHPTLIFGDPGENLQTIATERHPKFGNDFEKLLVDALELAERDGHVLLSTNCSTLREHALEVMARYGLKAARRAAMFHRQPPLPDFPPGAGASSIWLTLR